MVIRGPPNREADSTLHWHYHQSRPSRLSILKFQYPICLVSLALPLLGEMVKANYYYHYQNIIPLMMISSSILISSAFSATGRQWAWHTTSPSSSLSHDPNEDHRSLAFGDYVDPTFSCPATVTCHVVCVANATNCPMDASCPLDDSTHTYQVSE